MTAFFLQSCGFDYETQDYVLVDGSKKTFYTREVIDSDSLYVQVHESGEIFLKANRRKVWSSYCQEVFYYDENGRLMDYKFYFDDELQFYSRYNQNQEVVQLNGDPILWYGNPEAVTSVEPNLALVFETQTFTPPYMILRSWMNGNDHESATRQIKNNADSLGMKLIENDTIGYIFSVPDSSSIKVTMLWSLEDERTGKLLKAGKFSRLYTAKFP